MDRFENQNPNGKFTQNQEFSSKYQESNLPRYQEPNRPRYLPSKTTENCYVRRNQNQKQWKQQNTQELFTRREIYPEYTESERRAM